MAHPLKVFCVHFIVAQQFLSILSIPRICWWQCLRHLSCHSLQWRVGMRLFRHSIYSAMHEHLNILSRAVALPSLTSLLNESTQLSKVRKFRSVDDLSWTALKQYHGHQAITFCESPCSFANTFACCQLTKSFLAYIEKLAFVFQILACNQKAL